MRFFFILMTIAFLVGALLPPFSLFEGLKGLGLCLCGYLLGRFGNYLIPKKSV